MDFNSNSQRLEHLKNGEGVFEALVRLGGKATFSEIVTRIAHSACQPEDIVQPEVKTVLRSAVMNGYLVRHGKNYLLSRSCRTLYTDDSGKGSGNSFCSGNEQNKDVPSWWNRFWNRFVFRRKKCEPNKEEILSNCDEEPQSELDDSEPEADTPEHKISIAVSYVPQESPDENISDNNCSPKENENESMCDQHDLQVPFTFSMTDGLPKQRTDELKTSVSRHSIASANGLNFFVMDDESSENNCLD